MVQTVIFAASDSPDLYPLTVNKPKALVPVLNHNLLQYNLEQLAPFTTDWIVIVGHDEAKITGTLGSAVKKKPIKYLKLDQPWTFSDAIRAIRPHIRSQFLFTGLDLVLDREEIRNLISYSPGILTPAGEGVPREDTVISYVDKEMETSLLQPGDYQPSCYFFTQAATRLSHQQKGTFIKELYRYMIEHKARILYSGKCLPVRYAWDLLDVHGILLGKKKTRIRGTVEPGVILKKDVWIGSGTIVRTGTYIEGPVMIGNNCVVGPNCFIRGATCIGNNCRIGNAVELKNCIIGNNSRISHLSYLGDSIIGNDVNIGAGNISANLRHDEKKILTRLNGEKIDTGRKKLGVIIGDGVHTGIHNSFYPATKLWPHVDTLPGQVIRKDISG